MEEKRQVNDFCQKKIYTFIIRKYTLFILGSKSQNRDIYLVVEAEISEWMQIEYKWDLHIQAPIKLFLSHKNDSQ